MKQTIMAEKPSVAREIARIVGATKKADGYLEGNNYYVTWAFGHLVSLALPEEYGAIGFRIEHLPIIPDPFIINPRVSGKISDKGAIKQLNIINSLFEKSDKIIVAIDAGREGELIFRYIYNYLKCDKPFDRLWISSLTERAISSGLENLKDGALYDNLYYSAKARSQADWLIGINATQAMSIAAGQGTFSLGRVQTPTLAMICSRYLENKAFIPIPYFQISLSVHDEEAHYKIFSISKFDSRNEADSIAEGIMSSGVAVVRFVEKNIVNEEAPLLYDLTTLQKDANTKHGYSADRTLSIAQKLYELRHITYPRTGSRYISEDIAPQIPKLIGEVIKNQELFPSSFGGFASTIDTAKISRRSVNSKRVTDHHAILITETLPTSLSNDERTIYEMIAGRTLEAFSTKCVKEHTTVILDASGTECQIKGTTIIEEGWRKLKLNEPNSDEVIMSLEELKEGTELSIESIEVHQKSNNPKPQHTEATLLSAMENAGKELEDEQEKEAMKESGLGTPATRASIIETLFARDYIHRDKKSLVPTAKGLYLYEIVKDKKIADVSLTGGWESAIAQIESGTMPPESFSEAIQIFTKQITEELLSVQSLFSNRSNYTCPKCGKESICFYHKVAKCNSENCDFKVFKVIAGKELAEDQIAELITKGRTPKIRGFTSKLGKSFEAALRLDEAHNVVFDFPQKPKRS